MWLADRLTIYVIVATVVGARLGHFLFYENPSEYLAKPLEIFFVWKGGLASHGAAVGIVLGVILFARRYKALLGGLDSIRLLDIICVPTAFAGACIRFGNFCNQEILGTATTVPWAVIFGHPMDHSAPIPRHPVQLYEALLYLVVFALLWRLTYAPRYFLAKGRLIGLF
jgi:Prolipoprotein diacylglyceryltransferase